MRRRSSALLLVAALLLATAPQGSAAQDAPGSERVRVIVTMKTPFGAQQTDNLTSIDARLRHRFGSIPAISLDIPARFLPYLSRMPWVRTMQPDMQVTAFLSQSVPQIGANVVQATGNRGAGVKVCVVDTGVDDGHSAIATLGAEKDFVNNDNDAFDDNGHGTHVAGTIASQHATYKGVAPDATLMAAKVLDAGGSGYESDVIAGIEWCVTQGADVINLSLGGGLYSGACDNLALSQAVNAAVNNGVVVAVAAGNSGNASKISAPGCASKAIAVGAVTKSDVLASYSNRGSELDVVAPGSSITSTVPNNTFAVYSGTSMATPHVAGAAALLLHASPALTPLQVRTILQNTAIDLGAPGFDISYGYGRINVAAGVSTVQSGPPPTAQMVFSDDFTGGFSLWTESNELDWNVEGAAERAVPGKAGGNVVAHADACDSAQGCILTLTTPLDLSNAQSATLKFWRYLDSSLDAGEFLRLEFFNGSVWNTAEQWQNGDGDDDTWHEETVDLSAFLIDNFRMRFVGKASSTLEEVEVDDVRIEAYIPAGNAAPTANAGVDKTATDGNGNGGETVTLNGSGNDTDGFIVSYEWKEGATIHGNLATISPTLSVGVHTLTLTVTDNQGATGSDTVIVTVNANAAPTANAGSDQTVSDADNSGGETVTLNGSGNDTDGTIVSYEWKEGATVLGTTASIAPLLTIGTHTLTLKVTDNGGASATDTVTVQVVNNIAPTANAGTDKTVSDSNGNGSETVTLDGSGTDTDGTIASYEWKEGATILGTTASINPTLNVGMHTLTLTVTDDDGATGVDTILVTILANVAPSANAGNDQTISDVDHSGNETVTLSGQGTDTDGTIVSYEWKEDTTVLGTTPVINPLLTVGTHVITLTVTDNGTAASSDTVTVTVNPVAQGPQTLFFDDFAASLGQWIESGEPDWTVEKPTRQIPGKPNGNLTAHADGCSGTPCTLTMAVPVDASLFASVMLRFWRFVDLSIDSGEYLRVEVFNGSSWVSLVEWTDKSGDDNNWHLETFDLTPYKNPLLQIRFVSFESSTLEEVKVDDVMIEATP